MSAELSKYKDKIIVVSSENCPACKAFKERVKEQGLTDFEFMDAEKSELAQVLIDAFNIMSYPSFVKVSDADGKVVACLLNKDFEAQECLEASDE